MANVYDRQTGEEVFQTGAEVRDGIAEAEWTYHYNGEKLDAKPRYIFEVTGNRCRKAKSGECEIGMEIHKVMRYEDGEPMEKMQYTIHLSNGDEIAGTTGKNGRIDKEDLIPCKYEITIGDKSE